MKFLKRLWNLQLFAGEAAGDGGGEAAATGDNSVDAGHQRLLELGVPADKIRKNRAYTTRTSLQKPVEAEPKTEEKPVEQQAAAAGDNPTEEKNTETASRMSWDEIMADPEYNKQMQSVIRSRLKSARDAEEKLSKLAPAIEVLARKHGQDPNNPDYEALAKAINDDREYYEEMALKLGTSVETAMKKDQEERDGIRKQRQEQLTIEQQRFQQHIEKLEQQAEAMKAVYPNFDLQKEMQNPAFARMTAPGTGFMSVEDAYRAVHYQEIAAAQSQVIAEQTAAKISSSIASNSRRPAENGTSSQAPSVTSFNYRNASREQREALKRQIREAAARGEKVYPGR